MTKIEPRPSGRATQSRNPTNGMRIHALHGASKLLYACVGTTAEEASRPIGSARGGHINYVILGSSGPWMTLSPGGRRDMGQVKSLAQKMANHGYRVLIHDRRNCGLSDISIDPSQAEFEIWADDLHALLTQFSALPAI